MIFRKWRGSGGQRLIGTFPKIHPFWYRHPSLRKSIICSPNFLLCLGIWRCPMYWSHHWLVSWCRPYYIISVKLINFCYITYLAHLWEALAYLETLCFNPSWILPISTNLWFVIGWSIQYITCGSTCSKLLLYPPRPMGPPILFYSNILVVTANSTYGFGKKSFQYMKKYNVYQMMNKHSIIISIMYIRWKIKAELRLAVSMDDMNHMIQTGPGARRASSRAGLLPGWDPQTHPRWSGNIFFWEEIWLT